MKSILDRERLLGQISIFRLLLFTLETQLAFAELYLVLTFVCSS